jgi:spore germination protein
MPCNQGGEKVKKRSNSLIFVTMLLMLSGCGSWSVKNNIIEEISPTILLYVGRGADKHLEQATLIPPLVEEKKRVITANVRLMKEGRIQLNQKYYREMKSGQLRMLFISKSLAREDILPIVNTMMIDPEISDRLYLIVVEGDFLAYLNKQVVKQQEMIEFYLYKMLAHYEQQGEITVTNLHRFMEAYFSPYADPKIPLFTTNGTDLIYKGTALFHDGKMVGEITTLDDPLFQILNRPTRFQKLLSLPEQRVTLGSLHTETKVTVQPTGDVKIYIEGTGRVEEYQGERDLNQPEAAQQLTRELEAVLEQKAALLVKKLQQLRIDPLRIGERTLGPFSQPYTEETWKAAWPTMRVHVDVHLQLESLGLLKMKK